LKRHFDFDKFIIMSSRLGSKNLSTNYKKKNFRKEKKFEKN